MKIAFAAGLLAISTTCFGQLADMINLPEDDTPAAPQFTDEELFKTWGWLLSERFNLRGLELSEAEMAYIAEGMASQARGEEAPTDPQKAALPMQEYFAKREKQIQERTLVENREKEVAFFDSLFGLPDVQALGSGLHYQIIRPGNDVKPKDGDTVVVNYEGRFLDNTVFDSTQGRSPATFKLGQVIPGWTQGLQLIGEGGKIKLYVPSKLGYGDEGRAAIPPASTLVFEVELLKVGLPNAAGSVAPEAPVEPMSEAAAQ